MSKLTNPQRELLAKIRRAAFLNPFGRERSESDLEVSGLPGTAGQREILSEVISKTESVLRAASKQSAALRADDRDLVEKAALFCIFHRYTDSFDNLISSQVAGNESCRVDFADKALTELRDGTGCSRELALKYFAAFYQLRRAFYFISTALTGSSSSMQDLRRALWNNVFTADMGLYIETMWNRMEDFSTLLLGETGTGKGAAAAAIGRSCFIPFNAAARRFEESFMNSFISINLSQFPESLVESELFGHRKGSFTGAVEAHHGIFSRCSRHGAIFLDEIGEVPQTIQIKLLRVLQERRFSPVGSHETRRFSGRVIAATNRDLTALRSSRSFRDDFYYRLSSDTIQVPPLRIRLAQQPDELIELIRHCLAQILGTNGGDSRLKDISARIEAVINARLGPEYGWPGNVRELEQHIRSILVKGSCDPSGIEMEGGRTSIASRFEEIAFSADELLAGYCKLAYQRLGSYTEVAVRTKLDRRTVRKYILM